MDISRCYATQASEIRLVSAKENFENKYLLQRQIVNGLFNKYGDFEGRPGE